MENAAPARNWRLIGGGIGAMLLLIALYIWLFVADDLGSNTQADVADSGAATSEYAATRQMYAVTEVNIRDRPATKDSSIIGKLPRGSRVSGALKMGMDGTGGWFELAEGKGFIADVNLSETEPPVLVKLLANKAWTTDRAVEIWSHPGGSALLDRAGEGAQLRLAGLTDNDYLEISLKNGGVGYVADGAAILAQLDAKTVAVDFNPQTCNFGGELDGEFAKIEARLRSQWEALEDREFADDAAREKAYGAVEGKSMYVRLPRSFAGLSLTAIAQHYESQSLYFADPPAKVVEAFRARGFRIGRDGNFPGTELYAGISGTRGEGTAYGKTELGCGV